MTAERAAALAPEDTIRLTEFARSFRAALRAVALYPAGHSAIGVTLGRIVSMTSAEQLTEPLRIGVLARGLQMDGRAPTRPDAAIGELATILHDHLIGEMTVRPGGDLEAWRRFLLLLGRTPESVRAEGGISRLWAEMAGNHVELREIDYAEVLRERDAGAHADWEQVIARCLEGDAQLDLSDEAWRRLIETAGDPARLADVMADLDAQAVDKGHGIGQRTAALIRLLESIVESTTKYEPEKVDEIMRSMASALGRLPPDMMVSLLSQGGSQGGKGAELVNAVVNRMTDGTIATFVARNALAEDTSIDRVAEAFHSLVPDADHRERLIDLAHDEAASSPLGNPEAFEEAWDAVAQKLLTSYSDKPFVSEQYARELSGARTAAIEIEETTDDPPERIRTWCTSVAVSELRKLDLNLVLDLLRIEENTTFWTTMVRPAVRLLEDLLLVGDFDDADLLLASLRAATAPEADPDRRRVASAEIEALARGQMMVHVGSHLATIDDAQFDRVKAMCLSIGDVLVRPLVDALTTEERARPRERLSKILIGFGASGRQEAERLKGSPNAAVRRTAIYLLREFGGTEALPELIELLKDNEPQVQREAVRAMVNIGTEEAFQALKNALTNGTEKTRGALVQSLALVRDDGAAPLFAYLLQHVDHRGRLAPVYRGALEALGGLKDPQGIPALTAALGRGEWWAPGRTRNLRNLAAMALSKIGTPEAVAALEDVASNGPRGARTAANAHIAAARAALKRREVGRA